MRHSRRNAYTFADQSGRKSYLLMVGLIIFLIALSACQPDDPGPAAPPASENPGQATEAEPEADTIEAGWKAGPHADTFVTDASNENSACARCHAPLNWVPTMDDLPSGCYSCKFEIEDPPPFIPENEWTPIECKVCHEVDRNNNVAAEFKWLEIAAIDEYAEVESATALCQKCHTGAGLPDHMSIEVLGVHSTLACTECHDAHSTASACAASGCHEDWRTLDPPIVGHDSDHEAVSCVACHDAGSLAVGPDEGADNRWLTFASHTADGETVSAPFTSHNLQRDVACERCHFADNPWGLSAEVDAGPVS